jgi:hypothetical protein
MIADDTDTIGDTFFGCIAIDYRDALRKMLKSFVKVIT